MREKNCGKIKKLTHREAREVDVKIAFMEGIVRRDPHYVDALQILGDHYTQLGKHEHSLMDPDLRCLRKHPLYRSIEDKIRKMRVKIA